MVNSNDKSDFLLWLDEQNSILAQNKPSFEKSSLSIDELDWDDDIYGYECANWT